MSQEFAEFTHFRKLQAFPEMPGVSSIALAFAENLKLKMFKSVSNISFE
jgi:hypothetical protein